MKNFILSLLIIFLLIACAGFKEAGKVLRNEKIKTTDEFLVKKRSPLIMPPGYDEIPAPNTSVKKDENQQNKLEQIIRSPKQKNVNKESSLSLEKSILEKIRK